MSALPTRRPPAVRTDGAHHERPQRALRRGAGTLAALLAALLAVLAPAGAGAEDLPEVSVSLVGGVDRVPVLEGNDVRFELARTGALTETLQVALAVTYNGRATPRRATFPADEQTVQVDVTTVENENEVVDAAHHSLTVTIRPATTYQVSAESGTVRVVVPDDDIEISVRRASPSLDSVVEGETPRYYYFEASRNGDISRGLRVEMFAQTDDGRTLAALKANFPAGSGSTQMQLRLPENDHLHQADYTVTYGVAEIVGPVEYRSYRRGDPHTATFRVLDDDLPVVAIAAAPASAVEGTEFRFTVTRDGTTVESLTVPLSVTDSGDFLGVAAPSSVTFAVDAAEITLTLPTDDDDDDEADGTLTVTLAADPAYRIGAGAGTRSVTVLDDDLPVVTMAAQAYVIEEGETAVFVLTRRGDLSEPLTMSGQARFYEWHRPRTAFSIWERWHDVTFTAGSATATVAVAVPADDRYFILRQLLGRIIAKPGNWDVPLPVGGDPHTDHVFTDADRGLYVRVVVTDNDVGKVWVSPSADSVPESRRGGACFTLHTDVIMYPVGQTEVVLDVTVAVRQEGDYLAAGEAGQHTVTLEYGETAELCLDLVDDDVSEANGAVVVEVLSPSEGDSVVADPDRNTARVIVRDNELPVVTMAPAANVIAEGTTAEFVLTRSGDLSEPLTIPSVSFVGRPQPSFGLVVPVRKRATR